jgi:hypothetical protein
MTETSLKNPGTTLKKEQFEDQLNIINTKYNRWFGERINRFTGDTDSIHNYFRFTNTLDGNIELYLKDGLPLEIGKDCRSAFKAIFDN